ncbi:DnaD domain protein [Lachnobacterium bovis]|uniref:DnaD domain protein n=1 Tax=Lachnobacterium bovis TaxID=140626 RepID=UPI0004912BE1|nr:DnaD domain protein [Lachnobacterium bovis]
MSLIQLHNNNTNSFTCVSNYFIDHFMPEANGEYVKIYLYILKCISMAEPACSIAIIADYFETTEKDVIRALKYWEKVNLIKLDYSKNEITGIRLLPVTSHKKKSTDNVEAKQNSHNRIETSSMNINHSVDNNISDVATNNSNNSNNVASNNVNTITNNVDTNNVNNINANNVQNTNSNDINNNNNTTTVKSNAPAKKDYSANERSAFENDPEISELFFVIGTYFNKMLTPTEVDTILYWIDQLKFSPELVTHLVEYCISKDHASLRYMDKVAIAWHDNNITTIDQAKEYSKKYSKTYYGIMNALGISGRNLIPAELEFVKKWTKNYAFSMQVIEEACRRTISAIHQPSFAYTDQILSSWFKKKVQTLDDIKLLDIAYERSKKYNTKALDNDSNNYQRPKNDSAKLNNRFNNFNQRNYDPNKLEQFLINSNFKKDDNIEK